MRTGLAVRQMIHAHTAPTNGGATYGHHPARCTAVDGHLLALHEDGRMQCEHGTADPGDPTTTHAVNVSVTILLFEMLALRENQ